MVGISTDDRALRIVTEFCSGGSCFELLHGAGRVDLAWRQRLHLAADVAGAMRYLHAFSPQIIHRDLKSLNILLAHPVYGEQELPVVKVSDFGLSRMKSLAP